MEETKTVKEKLEVGLTCLQRIGDRWLEIERYRRGEHDPPFAPAGVDVEYRALQQKAVAPWLKLVERAPVQRLRVDGFRSRTRETAPAGSESADDVYYDIWQSNRMSERQKILFGDAVAHGRGILAVWPNDDNKRQPVLRVESPRCVYIQPKPGDPFAADFAVKAYASKRPDELGALEPDVAYVYTEDTVTRFDKNGDGWTQQEGQDNPLGAIPFVEFCPEVDAEGTYYSLIRPLIPLQQSIDTARFDILLAMQFAAYRQRAVTGFDPVVRDEDGEPKYLLDAGGKPVITHEGVPVPLVHQLSRPGVDRIIAFPSPDTKVFDLAESNMQNYIAAIESFVQTLAAISQVPPQYLLGGLANLSGEALAAAESTLASLVADLQSAFAASFVLVMRLAAKARGDDIETFATEVVWGDAQARGFAQTVDGITKLVSIGLPTEAAFSMIPGATDQSVRRWMDMRQEETQQALFELSIEDSRLSTQRPTEQILSTPAAAASS